METKNKKKIKKQHIQFRWRCYIGGLICNSYVQKVKIEQTHVSRFGQTIIVNKLKGRRKMNNFQRVSETGMHAHCTGKTKVDTGTKNHIPYIKYIIHTTSRRNK